MIAIIDVGIGNLRSVEKALHLLGYPAQVTAHTPIVARAKAVILPGVGAFARAITMLRTTHLAEALAAAVRDGKPLLGICLGQQLLFDSSEEFGDQQGLGLLPGQVKRFSGPQFASEGNAGLKIPHIGWNSIRVVNPHPVLEGIPDGAMFYFVHSFAAVPEQAAHTCAVTEYGVEFVSAVGHDNIFACQFHPEKSGRVGLRLLDNFARLAYPEGPSVPPGVDVSVKR